MSRKALLVAALASTTGLTPAPAQAEPISLGLVTAAAGSSAAAGTAGAIALAGGTASVASAGLFAGLGSVGALFSGPFGQLAIGLGLSAISNALFAPATGTRPSDRLVNYAQPIAYMQRVYGTVRVGGPYPLSKYSRQKRHYGVLVAMHETEGVVEHWLDTREDVQIDGSGNVTTEPYIGYVNIRPFLGALGQTADATLVDEFPEFTTAHDYKGLSGALLWCARVPAAEVNEVLPNGREPQYVSVWQGNNQIRDPRTEVVEFRANAALCAAHELIEYQGMEIDDAFISAAATRCGQTVTNKEGGTESRYLINGVLSDDMATRDILAQLIAATDGFFWERPDGSIGMHAGGWTEPTVTIRRSDFLGGVTRQSGQLEPGVAAEYVAKYVEPATGYKEISSGTYVYSEEGRRNRKEVSLYLVTSHNQACRLLARLAKVEHPEFKISGTIGLIGYELWNQEVCGPRFFRYIDELREIDTYIEVGRISRNADGFSFQIEGHTVSPTDWNFDAETEEPDRPTHSDLTGSSDDEYIGSTLEGSAAGGTMTWTWDDPGGSYQIQFRWREEGGSYTTVDLSTGTTTYDHAATGGTTYEAQIRLVSDLHGATTDWQPEPPATATA